MTHRGRWIPIAFVLAALTLFYFANRAAYQGYFSDDDLDNLGWPTFVGNDVFYNALITPKFLPSNFRPAGFLYYRYMGRIFKLRYPPYVLVLQTIHLLNGVLLFLILRRLDLPPIAAGAGTCFYLFHAAVMQVYWKPMYVFDLLCGAFCLATLLLYIRGHWILALPAFWLAYKTKEVTVMLPAGLFAYEWLLAKRNWKRLIPFFAISLTFGVQALWHNTQMTEKDVYALNFAPQMLWSAIVFYSSAIVFVPFGGLALFALLIFVRDRRVYLGLILMTLLLLPMVALSNRVSSAYWYVPLIGLAIVVAAVAAHTPRAIIALFFLLWLPLNYAMLRVTRKEIIASADERRWYVAGLHDYAKRVGPVKTVVFESAPPHMTPWGIHGALHLVFGQSTKTVWAGDPGASAAMMNVPVAIVAYYPVPHLVKGRLHTRNEPESAIDFHDNIPASQLGDGWYRDDPAGDDCRVAAKAEATLYRPAGAAGFEISGFVPRPDGPIQVTVLEDNRPLGVQTLSDSKGQTLRWGVPPGPPGSRHITILSNPVRYEAEDPREYGITIRSLRYVQK